MPFLYLNIFLILLIVLLLLLLSMVWPPDSPWSPWWKTDKKTAMTICDFAKIKFSDTVYELGSGDGEFLLEAAKHTGKKFVGIEIDPLRYLISRVRAKLAGLDKKIKIIKDNFYNVNLEEADVLYLYLVPAALKRLLPKLKKELKPRVKIVSLIYKMDLPLIKEDKENKLYLYRIS